MEEQKILEIKKNLLTSTEAAALFGVTNDYITQLCRKGKVSGTLEGRVWMVEEGSVKKYLDEVRSKIEVRRKDLSEKLRTVHEPQATPALPVPAAVAQVQKREGWGRGALALGVSALVVVALVGGNMVASADHAQSASVASAVRGFVAKVFGLSTETPFVETKTAPVAAVPVQQISNTTNNTYQNTYNNTYNTYPTIAAKESVSQNEFTTKLNELRKDIANIHSGGEGPVLSYAPAFRIDKLDNVTLSNAVVHSLSGLADSDIPDTITVANYLPLSGGTVDNLTITGTCTGCGTGSSDTNWSFFNNSGIKLATTTNQVLIGASATSTTAKLEVVGGASFDQATTTSFFTTTSSSTNSFTTNAFITNATTTTFFATVASSTQLYGAGLNTCNAGNVLTWSGGTFGCAVDQTAAGAANPFIWANNYGVVAAATTSPFWAQNGVFASSTSRFAFASTSVLTAALASTTNLTISSIVSGSLLKTTTAGSVVAAVAGTDYALPSVTPQDFTFTSSFGSVAAATSSLTLFTNGLSASSTVRFGNVGGSGFVFDSSTGKLALSSTTPWGRLSVDTSSSTAGAPSFVVGSSTRTDFVISQQGYTGIGTTSPLTTLDVYGNVALSGSNRYLNFGATSTASSIGATGYGFRDNGGTLEFKNAGGVWNSVNTATTGPSFLVHKNGTSQTVTSGVVTVLTWSAKTFDTNNNFDLSTGRFTPTVPGKYIFNLNVYCLTVDTSCSADIFKNGSRESETFFPVTTSKDVIVNANVILDMNGTTDYVEARTYVGDSTSPTISGGTGLTNFSGILVAPVYAGAGGGWTNDGISSYLIDNADLVGVGTSSPWAKLSVDTSNLGTDVPSFVIGSSSRTDFVVTQSGNVGIGVTQPPAKFYIQDGHGGFIWDASSVVSGYTASTTLDNTGLTFGHNSAIRNLQLRTAGTPRLTIDGGGNTGIGTTSPWGKLSVDTSSLDAGVPSFAVGSSSRTDFVITQSGNVGIGTTSPTAKFALTDSTYNLRASAAVGLQNQTTGSAAWLNIGTSNSAPILGWYSSSGASLGVISSTGSLGVGSTTPWARLSADTSSLGAGVPSFVIGSSSRTDFVVTQAGNVGIGTTTPGYRLSVAGSLVTTGDFGVGNQQPGSSAPGVRIYGQAVTANWGEIDFFKTTSGSNNAVIFLDNGVSVGSIIYTDSATSYNTSSDRRIKENISTTTLGLDTLLRLPVRDYHFIKDPAGLITTGFIAQELQQIFPDAVTTNGDNGTDELASTSTPWSVDYGRVTPLIVKAIQDLNFKVEDMATTTASSSLPQGSFTAHFFNALFVRITTWLADAGNGVGSIFAKTFHAKEEICIDDQCLTRDDVRALLILTHSGGQASGGGSPQPPPAPPGAPEEASSTPPTTEGPDTEATSTPPAPQTPGEEPAPAQESASAPESAPQTSPEAPVVSQTTEESQ